MSPRSRSPLRPAVAAVALLLACTSAARSHTPHDHAVGLAVSPTFAHDGTVFATVRMNLLRSRDGGMRWDRLQRGITCGEQYGLNAIAISPAFADDGTFFVACGRPPYRDLDVSVETSASFLYRSTDGGDHFEEVSSPGGHRLDHLVVSPRFPDDRSLLAVDSGGALHHSSDRGATWQRRLPGYEITEVRWWPDELAVGTHAGALLVSADGGSSWHEVARHPEGRPITALERLPRTDGQPAMIAGTAGGGVVEVDRRSGGVRDLGLAGRDVTSLALTEEDGAPVLLASGWRDGAYRSDDLGATWREAGRGLIWSAQADDYGQPGYGPLAPTESGAVFLATFCGVFRSDSSGRDWYKLETIFHNVSSLDVAPTSAGPVLGLATYGSGVMLSADGGASWEFRNRGITHPRLTAFALSPSYGDDRKLLAGTFGRMLASGDAGERWTQIWNRREQVAGGRLTADVVGWADRHWPGVLPWLRRYLDFYEVDELAPTPTSIAVSPRFAEDRTAFAGMHPNGIARTTDGGDSWRLVWGAHGGFARSLAVSPDFPRDGTVFAGVEGRLYRSRDRGKSWRLVGGGLPDSADHPAVVAISPAFARDRTVLAGTGSGLYHSVDGGDSWRRLAAADFGGTISALALSPAFASDGLLLAQEWAGDLWAVRLSGGRVEAERVALPDPTVDFSAYGRLRSVSRTISFSPEFAEDRTIWAVSGRRLLRSRDAGASWSPLPRPLRYEAEMAFDDWFVMPLRLDGTWTREEDDLQRRWSRRTERTLHSSEAGARARLSFVGSTVRWLCSRGPDGGTAAVDLDGARLAEVALYAEEPTYGDVCFAAEDLPLARHTLTVEVQGGRVDVEAFDVTP